MRHRAKNITVAVDRNSDSAKDPDDTNGSDKSSKNGSTIATFIERFRRAPPRSPEQRRAQTDNSKLFWWKNGEEESNDRPSSASQATPNLPKFDDHRANSLLQRDTLIDEESQVLNDGNDFEMDGVDEIFDVQELNRRADEILARHKDLFEDPKPQSQDNVSNKFGMAASWVQSPGSEKSLPPLGQSRRSSPPPARKNFLEDDNLSESEDDLALASSFISNSSRRTSGSMAYSESSVELEGLQFLDQSFDAPPPPPPPPPLFTTKSSSHTPPPSPPPSPPSPPAPAFSRSHRVTQFQQTITHANNYDSAPPSSYEKYTHEFIQVHTRQVPPPRLLTPLDLGNDFTATPDHQMQQPDNSPGMRDSSIDKVVEQQNSISLETVEPAVGSFVHISNSEQSPALSHIESGQSDILVCPNVSSESDSVDPREHIQQLHQQQDGQLEDEDSLEGKQQQLHQQQDEQLGDENTLKGKHHNQQEQQLHQQQDGQPEDGDSLEEKQQKLHQQQDEQLGDENALEGIPHNQQEQQFHQQQDGQLGDENSLEEMQQQLHQQQGEQLGDKDTLEGIHHNQQEQQFHQQQDEQLEEVKVSEEKSPISGKLENESTQSLGQECSSPEMEQDAKTPPTEQIIKETIQPQPHRENDELTLSSDEENNETDINLNADYNCALRSNNEQSRLNEQDSLEDAELNCSLRISLGQKESSEGNKVEASTLPLINVTAVDVNDAATETNRVEFADIASSPAFPSQEQRETGTDAFYDHLEVEIESSVEGNHSDHCKTTPADLVECGTSPIPNAIVSRAIETQTVAECSHAATFTFDPTTTDVECQALEQKIAKLKSRLEEIGLEEEELLKTLG